MADEDSSLPNIEPERDYGYDPPPSPPPVEPQPEPDTGYDPPPPPPETVIDVIASDEPETRGYNPPPPPPIEES